MSYVYKYIPAGMSFNGMSPKDQYVNLFQETLNANFNNASTIWSIFEEDVFASLIFNPVDVRITHVIDSETGDKKGDDYKAILFRDLQHATSLGYKYYFSSNYWIVESSEISENIAASCTVVRCNNTLRWQTSDGAIYSEPCSIKLEISRNKNLITTGGPVVEGEGLMQIECQFNDRTNTIQKNQRFLFGNADNWSAWRVSAGGLVNFNNLQTLDNMSPGIVHYTCERDFENSELDDFTNGICFLNAQTYILSLNQTSITGGVGQTIQLVPTVTLNGTIVSRNVTWSSSNKAKATVDVNGLVTMVAVGSAVITCTMEGNTSVYTTCSALVAGSPSDTYEIRIAPNKNTILEGVTQSYTAYLFKNGTQQSGTVSFTDISSGVPSDDYIFSVTGNNSFTVKNYSLYLDAPVIIQCSAGIYSNTISINLRGVY
jgi:hypothetical protein